MNTNQRLHFVSSEEFISISSFSFDIISMIDDSMEIFSDVYIRDVGV